MDAVKIGIGIILHSGYKRNGKKPFLLQRAEANLVTGNKKHFPIKPYVVTPRELLDILENLPE